MVLLIQEKFCCCCWWPEPHLAWRQDAIRSVLQLEIKPGMVLAFQLLIENRGGHVAHAGAVGRR